MSERDLVVRIIGDDRSLTQSYKRSIAGSAQLQRGFKSAGHEAKQFDRDLSHTLRGAAAGSGLFRSLGRSLAFASGGFVAVASITGALRASFDAAQNAARTQRQLATQFRANGKNLADYRSQIEETTQSLSALSGFTNDDLLRSFTTAFRATGSVSKALKIEKISADAARGSHKDLNTITLALTRAWGGASTSLRRLGILIPTTAKGMDALAFVQHKFAGQARAGTTAQERFAAVLHDTEENIGSAMLPEINNLLNTMATWLGKTENQRRLQRDFNETLRSAKSAIHQFSTELRLSVEVLRPAVTLVGGLGRAIKILVTALVARKLLQVASASKLLGANAATAAVGINAEAAAQERLNVAMLGAPAGALGAGRGLGLALGAGALKAKFRNPLTAGPFAAALAGYALTLGQQGETSKHVGGPLDASVLGDLVSYRDPVTGKYVMAKGHHGQSVKAVIQADLLKRHPELKPQQKTGEDVRLRGASAIAVDIARAVADPKRNGLHQQYLRSQLALSKAQAVGTTADVRTALESQKRILKAALALTTNLQKRRKLYDDLYSVEQQITSIDNNQAKTVEDARKKQLAARKAALAAEAKRLAEQKTVADKELATFKQRDRTLTAKIKQITEAFKQGVQNAQQTFLGDLFQGSVLNFSDAQRKAALGIPNPASDPKALLADLRSQVRAGASFNASLNRLRKRGASAGLVSQIEAGGLSNAPEAAALAGAPKSLLRSFFREFGKGQRLVQSIARAEMRVKLATLRADRVELKQVRAGEQVFHVYINGIEDKQAKVRVKQSATQRRGPVPGRA